MNKKCIKSLEVSLWRNGTLQLFYLFQRRVSHSRYTCFINSFIKKIRVNFQVCLDRANPAFSSSCLFNKSLQLNRHLLTLSLTGEMNNDTNEPYVFIADGLEEIIQMMYHT